MRIQGRAIVLMVLAVTACGIACATSPRQVIDLREGWRFKQGPETAEAQAVSHDDSQWMSVTLPHTWNRIGNEGVIRAPESNHYRGQGWYRLAFNSPASLKGKRAFLQFDGVGAIADVWVNGRRIGRHEGAFSRFRFDVTEALNREGSNLLAVKADNSRSQRGSPTEHVIPLAGDFVIFGGLYRDVSLILTTPVHVDMADYGGPGVYGRALEITPERATVSVSKRLTNNGATRQPITVATRIEDAAGIVVASSERRETLAAGATTTVESQLRIDQPRRWRGVADPYLYRIVVALRGTRGDLLDEVVQPLGLRTFNFDPDEGFLLNGERLALVGASMHQDRPVKGWAVSRADRVEDFDLLQEMGGNAVRLAHYQHDQFAYELADARGIVTWAEIPLVSDVSHDGSPPSDALIANAHLQLNELIRQNYNHPSIVVWSLSNEVDLRPTTSNRPARSGNLLRSLNALAKQLDPGRFTTQADCCEQVPSNDPASGSMLQPRDRVVDLADTLGYNKYFGWYYGKIADLGPYLDAAHKRHPSLPLAVSEYGAGSGLTQHSDSARGGPINPFGRPHPEEFQMYFHEESWRQIRERPYLWGAFIWNLFDFASDDRKEGDLTDINEKGMISYNRSVKKDLFYFYKANWSRTPTLHLTGRRYIDRAYGVVDVKAYSNASQVQLSLNGHAIGTTSCNVGICVWPGVRLAQGLNHLTASAQHSGTALTDSVQWTFSGSHDTLRIKAGDLSGFVSPDGTRYGSDDFFEGGEGQRANDAPALYNSYRIGTFTYNLPLPDGEYDITAKFVEPTAERAGQRTFDVLANGRVALSAVDPFALAGGKLKPAEKTFRVRATSGHLRIEFRPRGNTSAVLSSLEAVRRDAVQRSAP